MLKKDKEINKIVSLDSIIDEIFLICDLFHLIYSEQKKYIKYGTPTTKIFKRLWNLFSRLLNELCADILNYNESLKKKYN